MPHTEPSLLHAVVQLARTYSDSGEGDTRKRISIRSRSGRLLNVDTVAEPDLTDVGMVPEPGQELGLVADDAAAGAGGDSMVGYYAQGTGEPVLVGTYSNDPGAEPSTGMKVGTATAHSEIFSDRSPSSHSRAAPLVGLSGHGTQGHVFDEVRDYGATKRQQLPEDFLISHAGELAAPGPCSSSAELSRG